MITGSGFWIFKVLDEQMILAGRNQADLSGSLKVLMVSIVYPWYAFSVGETIYPWFPLVLPAAGVVIFLVFRWFIFSQCRGRRLLFSLIILPVLLPSLVINFVSTGTPFINLPVHTLFVMPYFSLAVGGGWVTLYLQRWRMGVTILIGITWVYSLYNYYTNKQFINPIYISPTREVAQQVILLATPQDIVIGEKDSGFTYYHLQTGGGKAPYFEALDTENIIIYLSSHKVRNIWLVIIGRDSSRYHTPLKTLKWLKENWA